MSIESAQEDVIQSATALSAFDLMNAGGPVVAILLVMSLLALSLVFAKLVQFQRLHVGREAGLAEAVVQWSSARGAEAQRALAIRRLADDSHPLGAVIATAMRGFESGGDSAVLREEVLRLGRELLFELRRGLRPLEVIAATAPLIGLLGTVIGMIKAFQALEAAGSQVNPAVLSGGIWEALLTTAIGLCVAIPAVAALNWLERRVDHLAHVMENLVTQVFTVDVRRNEGAN